MVSLQVVVDLNERQLSALLDQKEKELGSVEEQAATMM